MRLRCRPAARDALGLPRQQRAEPVLAAERRQACEVRLTPAQRLAVRRSGASQWMRVSERAR